MRKSTDNLLALLKKVVGLLFLYTLCRLFLYVFYYSYFSDLSLPRLLLIMLSGCRFDLSVIVLSNVLFIILYMLPFAFRDKSWYRSILKWLFLIVNSIALLANCVDMIYFEFTLKRTTADVFHFFGGEIGNDLMQLLPLFMMEYWYIIVIWLMLTFVLHLIYSKTEAKNVLVWDKSYYFYQAILFIGSIIVSIIAYRGGFQLKPISTVTAGEYAPVKYVPLIVNTPFTILKTLDIETIEPVIYYKDRAELEKYYDPVHLPKMGDFKKLNVFIIALESFSKEYIGSINGRSKGCTPFLDSIISEGLVFTNGFSNGKKSIEGIPAIVSGIPTWMNEAYSTSPYGSNQTNSLANLLKEEGYYTAFFHGGTNGTMGFDAFVNLAGYDDYYGRTEYANEKDYDGNWGIWDEEFFKYTATVINKKPQPFFVTLFSLTSHHPYNIPEKYKAKFKNSGLEIEKGIGYSDHSLRLFFEMAKKMPWFNNTLFVFCADHTGVSADPFYVNRVGNNAIPIIYYLPNGQLKGRRSIVTQQIDIMPSVLDYLNYPKPYFAFGNSVFDTTAMRFALTYNSELFQLISGDYSFGFNGNKALDLYKYTTDSLLQNNLIDSEPLIINELEAKVKAIIQTYQQSLINNKQRVIH